MIQKQEATVFYAPTKGRRYFRLGSAISAEAKAMIFKKYPAYFEEDTGAGYHMPSDEPERYDNLHKRLSKFIFHRYCNGKV